MKALGQGSLASILKRILDVAWYLVWGLLGVASIVMVTAAATFLMDIMGYTPGRVSHLLGVIHNLGMAFPNAIAPFIAALLVIDRLRRIIATLIAGDPFVPENAGHLRVIAIVIGVYQVVRHAIQGAWSMMLTFMDRPIFGGAEISVTHDINLGAWFSVVVLLVFAEVFREGARMRQEQKLTI